jgi:hypothetical protein
MPAEAVALALIVSVGCAYVALGLTAWDLVEPTLRRRVIVRLLRRHGITEDEWNEELPERQVPPAHRWLRIDWAGWLTQPAPTTNQEVP